ncbi:unnamed protein product [Prorocentrum cordatum]|uniref:Uncharacterized protein n=1 Tax=Prorocentrum cordatum TaxID=2364126 RepID=A0ABN9YCH7_9DINO|nr:unnamed protein product [Polarella glacialis]
MGSPPGPAPALGTFRPSRAALALCALAARTRAALDASTAPPGVPKERFGEQAGGAGARRGLRAQAPGAAGRWSPLPAEASGASSGWSACPPSQGGGDHAGVPKTDLVLLERPHLRAQGGAPCPCVVALLRAGPRGPRAAPAPGIGATS